MPFLDLLDGNKSNAESRDYIRELMSHRVSRGYALNLLFRPPTLLCLLVTRTDVLSPTLLLVLLTIRGPKHFEHVLAEAYECKILSNPWLAASTAARYPAAGAPDPPGNAAQAPPEKGAPDAPKSAAAVPDPPAAGVEDLVMVVAATGTSDAKLVDREAPNDPSAGPVASDVMLEVASSLASLDSTAVGPGAAAPAGRAAMDEEVENPSEQAAEQDDEATAAAAAAAGAAAAKEQPRPEVAAPSVNIVNCSEATFGLALRGKFFEAAQAIRAAHGLSEVKEPGEDPELDYLVNEVMLTYQKLKVRLLKASNQEAQFRLGLETKVAAGIWNQYDVSEGGSSAAGQNPDGDFVVYESGSPSRRQQPRPQYHAAGGAGGAGARGQVDSMRLGRLAGGAERGPYDPRGRDTSFSSSSDERGGGSASRAGSESKRSSSGKFEKDQVLPLTEWLLKHSSNPYPSMDDKAELAIKSGLSTQQVQNWFINMRKRHWTPMMNGKRRPRTFLDYVILSSQQGDSSRTSSRIPSQRKVYGSLLTQISLVGVGKIYLAWVYKTKLLCHTK